MSLTSPRPRYATLALAPTGRPLTYADYALAGYASAYGRVYPTASAAYAVLTRLAPALGVTLAPDAYSPRYGYAYVGYVPSAGPSGRTVVSRIALGASLTLLTLYPLAGEAEHALGVVVRGLGPLRVRRGSVVALTVDTALGAGYARVLRAGR